MRGSFARAAAAAVGLPALLVFAVVASAAAATPGERLEGVWLIDKPVFAVRTTDGAAPPLKPEAAELLRQHLAAGKGGDASFDSASWCASVGMPRLMFIRAPFEIVARPGRIVFLHQWNWWTRIAYVADKMPPEPAPPGPAGGDEDASSDNVLPGAMGSSLARWEGETLVIETSNLTDTTLLDTAGTPHSDELKLTERLRIVADGVMEDVIQVQDPQTFTRPWETRATYRRQPAGTRIKEDVCLDRIRDGRPAVEQ